MENNINITDGQLGVAFSENLLTNFIVVNIHGKQTVILKPQPKRKIEFTDESFESFFALTANIPGVSDKEFLRSLLKHSVEFLNNFWSWKSSKQTEFVAMMESCADSPDEILRKKSGLYSHLAKIGLRLQAEFFQVN